MSGMSALTGRKISGLEHIQQSISNILSTPIGSRIQRREYGSMLSELIDQPTNSAVMMQLRAAVVMAIAQWEPRVRLLTVNFTVAASKTVVLLDLQRLDTGTQEQIEVPV